MTSRPGAVVVRRADHVGFSVSSLPRALRFWTEALGAREERRGEMGGDFLAQVTGAQGASVRFAVVTLAGQAVELLEFSGAERPSAPAAPYDPGFAHLALVVDDLEAAAAGIAPHGWRLQGVPQLIGAGVRAGTRVVYAVGPDGETIEFMQPPVAPLRSPGVEAPG